MDGRIVAVGTHRELLETDACRTAVTVTRETEMEEAVR